MIDAIDAVDEMQKALEKDRFKVIETIKQGQNVISRQNRVHTKLNIDKVSKPYPYGVNKRKINFNTFNNLGHGSSAFFYATNSGFSRSI